MIAGWIAFAAIVGWFAAAAVVLALVRVDPDADLWADL